jgi:hypothetical protein
MGLLNNCIRTQWAGIADGSAPALLPTNWNCYEQFAKFLHPVDGSAALKTVSSPTGYQLPACFHPPINLGEMSVGSQGDGTLAANLYPTRAMSIDLTGLGDLDATAALVIAMAAALTGSGTLTATIQGRLNASIDLTGSGDLDATIAGLASLLCELTGSGDLDATIAAYANLAVDIVVTGTGLSTANVGQAVLDAIAENGPDGSYTLAEILRIIAAHAAGLKSGGPDSPAFKAISDATKTRIDGEADSSGNRTSVTLDPS